MKNSKFGLIGHPISHSLSPSLFKAGYGGKYQYDLIEGEDFEKSYQRFLDGYAGINVTAPFKELACKKADILSEECRLIRATNLLVKTPEGVKAFNSDYLGVRLWLSETSEPSHTCLVAGCGGAGKAAAFAAASLGLKIILINRDISKAEEVAQRIMQMERYVGSKDIEVCGIEEFRNSFRKADIIIYNIPASIPGLQELTSEDFRGKHILEANYKNPSFDNKLIDRIIHENPATIYTPGQKWLLYQAVTGYSIFTGETPDLSSMEDVI